MVILDSLIVMSNSHPTSPLAKNLSLAVNLIPLILVFLVTDLSNPTGKLLIQGRPGRTQCDKEEGQRTVWW